VAHNYHHSTHAEGPCWRPILDVFCSPLWNAAGKCIRTDPILAVYCLLMSSSLPYIAVYVVTHTLMTPSYIYIQPLTTTKPHSHDWSHASTTSDSECPQTQVSSLDACRGSVSEASTRRTLQSTMECRRGATRHHWSLFSHAGMYVSVCCVGCVCVLCMHVCIYVYKSSAMISKVE